MPRAHAQSAHLQLPRDINTQLGFVLKLLGDVSDELALRRIGEDTPPRASCEHAHQAHAGGGGGEFFGLLQVTSLSRLCSVLFPRAESLQAPDVVRESLYSPPPPCRVRSSLVTWDRVNQTINACVPVSSSGAGLSCRKDSDAARRREPGCGVCC